MTGGTGKGWLAEGLIVEIEDIDGGTGSGGGGGMDWNDGRETDWPILTA